MWFIDFGAWELDVLLRNNETRQNLNTYLDQSFWRITNEQKNTTRAGNSTSWAMVVNMDGYGLAQAFDFTARAYLQEMVAKHISHLKTLEYAIVINCKQKFCI